MMPPMAAPLEADSVHRDTPFTRWLERWRVAFFAGLVVILLIPFNGQWRMGLDSSLYRGLAESVAAGQGYVFAGVPQKQAYFGLPYALAALQKIVGSNSVVPVLVLMSALALAALWATYQLIATRYPRWIAVVVTCGVGMNIKFVQQAHEVMTDMPFLLGCLLAMLGWEWLADPSSRRRRAAWALLPVGLALAASMRPTFWVLALAWVITCSINIVRRRERRSMIALAAIVVIALLTAAVDPRVRGLNVLQGGYERELLSIFGNGARRVIGNVPSLLSDHLPETFFNERMVPLSYGISVVLLVGAVLVTRRQPLWGLQVLILTGVMLVLSDEPRYYLMVLPTLWLGFVLVLLALLRRVATPRADVALFVAFSLANFLNLAGVGRLAYEQHHGDFAKSYRNGELRPWVKVASLVREKVPAGANVIGPHGNLLAYLSGRNVLSARLLGLDVAPVGKYPQFVARAEPKYLIGPHPEYDQKDLVIGRLIRHGVVRPGKFVASITENDARDQPRLLWLSTMSVEVPAVHWTKLPTTRPIVQTDGPDRRGITPEQVRNREIKAARERKRIRLEREERRQRNVRKQIRAQRQKAAMTQPATQPTTDPSGSSPSGGG
jgi:hypothetical protein